MTERAKRTFYPKQDRPPLYQLLTDTEYVGQKLNLGCGYHHIKGCINIDNNPDCEPDEVMDINQVPWPKPLEINSKEGDLHRLYPPWPEDTVNYVCSLNTLEHIDNLLGVMGEIWRVCKPGARVEIIVPNCLHQAAFEDPTHVRFFGISSFQYWNANTYNENTGWYTTDRFHFELENAGLIQDEEFEADRPALEELQGDGGLLSKLMIRIFQYYAVGVNRYLLFRLKVVKPLPDSKQRTIHVYE